MFYHYSQNNSGGSFDFNLEKGITHHVVIEADSANKANRKAEDIGLYFDGCETGDDCPCCGDRWSEAWNNDGDEVPSVYSKPLGIVDTSPYGWMEEGREIVVHFADGSKKWYGRDYLLHEEVSARN